MESNEKGASVKPDEKGVSITTPDGDVVIVKIDGSADDACDVEVDAPDEFDVKRF